MAPSSPTSSVSSDAGGPTLAGINSDLRRLTAAMITKHDLQILTTKLHDSIATAVTALRSDAEKTEELDNRSRRSNIRIRGVPEPQGEEDVEGLLTALFHLILGDGGSDQIRFDRETIMRKARSCPTWSFQETEVSIYNDLSCLTLEACRALRPITQAPWDKNIPYKWPEEVPAFLQKLELRPIQVTNWVLDPLGCPPRTAANIPPPPLVLSSETTTPTTQPMMARRRSTSGNDGACSREFNSHRGGPGIGTPAQLGDQVRQRPQLTAQHGDTAPQGH
ncbi:Hypothetical predicted protein [Pelobates cultripes]|uniref:Uncharacterized protein n=1 Tax=Pelobates cultripes TaxID=61616 RepID=A0AAD1RQ96_PELCU|nr:Hypothetical predicted protein [Pelobates cultripes]